MSIHMFDGAPFAILPADAFASARSRALDLLLLLRLSRP
jgi:hypothetical protein